MSSFSKNRCLGWSAARSVSWVGVCLMVLTSGWSARASAACANQEWQAFDWPSLCHSNDGFAVAEPLLNGQHIWTQTRRALNAPAKQTSVAFPKETLRRLLDAEARREQWELEFHPTPGRLIARGSAAAMASLTQILEELEVQGDARAISLRATRDERPLGEVELQHGQWAWIGEQRSQAFLASFDVEVASDSGVADPIVGQVWSGDCIALRAFVLQWQGERQIWVEGVLDSSELTELEEVSFDTPDLGNLQRPVVDVCQVCFSGWLKADEPLWVQVDGASPQTANGRLVLTEVPSINSTELSAAPSWRALDLALLERSPTSLPMPQPGQANQGFLASREGSAMFTGLSAMDALQGATQFINDREAWSLLESSYGWIVGTSKADALWNELDQQVALAVQRLRPSGRLQVESGALRVSLPVSSSASARVLHGRATTRISDYDVTLAPESWMPMPEVSTYFDGLALQAELRQGKLHCQGWLAQTDAVETLGRRSSSLGTLELSKRRLQSGRWKLAGRGSSRVLFGDPEQTSEGSPAVRASWSPQVP